MSLNLERHFKDRLHQEFIFDFITHELINTGIYKYRVLYIWDTANS